MNNAEIAQLFAKLNNLRVELEQNRAALAQCKDNDCCAALVSVIRTRKIALDDLEYQVKLVERRRVIR